MTLPQSVLALLATTGLRIFDGKVDPNPSLPYVVVFFGENEPQPTSLEGTPDLFEDSFQTTAVGSTAEQIRAVRAKLDAALFNVRPSVTGRDQSRISRTMRLPATEDRDLAPSVIVGVDRWSSTSTSA